jgi:hypothetical protein
MTTIRVALDWPMTPSPAPEPEPDLERLLLESLIGIYLRRATTDDLAELERVLGERGTTR